MNFASDNVVGASRPVLEALVAANDGAQASYGIGRPTASAPKPCSRTCSSTRLSASSCRHRNGRKRPGAGRAHAALGCRVLPRGEPRYRRRVWRAGDVLRRSQARRHPRCGWQDHSVQPSRRAACAIHAAWQNPFSRRPCRSRRSPRPERVYSLDRDRSPQRSGSRSRTRCPSRRRALRECHGRAWLHRRGHDVEGWRGRRLLRRH